MEIDINDIDFDSLRNDLKDYFGSATPFIPFAYSDVVNVDLCTDIDLLNLINQTDLNIYN